MKLSEKQQIFAVNVARLILWANEQGYRLTFGEAYRTPEMAEIYAKRGIGIKDSQHCKRLAVDFNLFVNGQYQRTGDGYTRLGIAWEALHEDNRAGYHFGDGNHFEMKG
jgi:hypothetical protein